MVVVRCLLFSKSAKILHCIVFSFTAEYSVTGSPFSGTKMVLRDQKSMGMIGETGATKISGMIKDAVCCQV